MPEATFLARTFTLLAIALRTSVWEAAIIEHRRIHIRSSEWEKTFINSAHPAWMAPQWARWTFPSAPSVIQWPPSCPTPTDSFQLQSGCVCFLAQTIPNERGRTFSSSWWVQTFFVIERIILLRPAADGGKDTMAQRNWELYEPIYLRAMANCFLGLSVSINTGRWFASCQLFLMCCLRHVTDMNFMSPGRRKAEYVDRLDGV